MKKAQRWFPLLSITWLLSAALAAAGDPAAPPGMSAKDFGPPWKVWFGVYGPDGTKMGAASAAFSQGSDPANPVYKLELSASITAITMERSQVLEFDGKPPFALRKGSAKFTQGAISKLVDLAGSAEGLEATITEGGKPRTKKIPGEYALGDALAAAHWLRQQERKPGEKFISRELDLLEIKVEEVTLTVRALKQTQSHAVKLAYYELGYDSSIHGDMGVVNTGRDGQPLTTKLAGQFDLRSEPEGLAKLAEYRSPFCLEILAKLDRPMGNLKAAGGAVLEATGEAAAKIPAGTRQAVAFNEQTNTTELKLGAAHSAPAKATPEEIQEHLKASPAYPIREAQVSTLAKQAVGDAKTEQEKVERLVVFVAGFLSDRYSPSAVSVAEIISSKKGDCGQRALLFTTLARAAGLAAREVFGLVYQGDKLHAFGAHAWSEVVVDGIWTPVDPTLKEADASTARILLAPEEKGLGPAQALAGRLEFKLREVTPAKQP